MKKAAIIFGILMIATVFSFQNATAEPFEQETYLFLKTSEGVTEGDPWLIIAPDDPPYIAEDSVEFTAEPALEETDPPNFVPFGKLEYETFGEEFCFDFKGYNLPAGEYALIYYVDPGPGTWGEYPDVYVLGVEEAQDYLARGKSKQFPFWGVKIGGCCDVGQIPDPDDENYPNGGKIWLVPKALINLEAYPEDFDGDSMTGWAQMNGWDEGSILFETSLITFGFVAE